MSVVSSRPAAKFNEIRELALRIVIKAEWAARDAGDLTDAEYGQRLEEFIDEARMLARELDCELVEAGRQYDRQARVIA